MKKKPLYSLTDHACRFCAGRILMQENAGPTGGGNPIFECADCGRRACDMTPDPICWCGFTQRRQEQTGNWFCMRLDEAIAKPWVADAFAHCGVDGKSDLQVGLMNREILRTCEQRYDEAKSRQNKSLKEKNVQ